MAAVAPPVYSRVGDLPRLMWTGRVFALGLATACLAALLAAASVPPSPTGVGTHQALGLERCGFEARFGLPCMTCGMTTSFALFARGSIVGAVYVQPAGAAAALAAAAIVWVGLYLAITGRPAHRLLRTIPSRWLIFVTLGLFVAGWAWKIMIHLSGIDGWN